MTGRRTLLVIASALCAALGTALVWLYVQAATRAPEGADTATVLVANGTAEEGTDATSIPTRRQVVLRAGADGALQSLSEVAGQVLVTRVVPEQVLLRTMFGPKAVPGVKPTNVAVSLTVTDARRVASLLRPGLDVAVYVVPESRCPRLVLGRATVVRVGSEAPTGQTTASGQPVTQQIVTFEVPPLDAVALIAIKPGDDVALGLLGVDAQAKKSACS